MHCYYHLTEPHYVSYLSILHVLKSHRIAPKLNLDGTNRTRDVHVAPKITHTGNPRPNYYLHVTRQSICVIDS